MLLYCFHCFFLLCAADCSGDSGGGGVFVGGAGECEVVGFEGVWVDGGERVGGGFDGGRKRFGEEKGGLHCC